MAEVAQLRTSVSIVQEAMRRIGAIPIQSFDAQGPAAGTPEGIFNSVLETTLGSYPWHHRKKTGQLVQLTDPPARGWQYQYKLPAERIGPPRAYYDSKDNAFNSNGGRPVTRFQLEGDRVWTDCSELWAEYPVIPPVTHWPGYFKEVMIKACMLEFALSIREDRQLRNQLYTELYGDPRKPGELGYFSIATDMDSQAQPSFPADGGRNPVHSAGWAEGDIRNDFDEF